MPYTTPPLLFIILGLLGVAGVIAQTPLATPLKGYLVWLQSQATSHPLLVGAAVLTVGLLLGVAAVLADGLSRGRAKRRAGDHE